MGIVAIAGAFVLLISILLAETDGVLGDISVWLAMIGLVLLVFGLLFGIKPMEVDAQTELSLVDRDTGEEVPLNSPLIDGYPTAGVTAHLGIVLDNALHDEVPAVSGEDIELLARLITAEQGYADNYDDEMEYEERAYLCGSVVINRIKSDKFPNTLQEVVTQSGQYQCVTNGHINRPYDDIAFEIAEELLVYGTTIDEDIVFCSEFEQGSGVFKKIGNTYFCYQ